MVSHMVAGYKCGLDVFCLVDVGVIVVDGGRVVGGVNVTCGAFA